MAFTAGQKLTAADLNALSTADTYTPVLASSGTNPNVGADGYVTGRYHRNGLHIWFSIETFFSGTGANAGTGFLQWSLPFDADTGLQTASLTAGEGTVLGMAFHRDNSASATSATYATYLISTDDVWIAGHGNAFNATQLATGDYLSLEGVYVADPADLP